MCIVKTPKIDPQTEKPREPTVIRNPYLDGVGPQARAARKGRSSLRITRARNAPQKRQGDAPPISAPRPSPVISRPQPGPSPVHGGGGGGAIASRRSPIHVH
jgi:hypothetical protein